MFIRCLSLSLSLPFSLSLPPPPPPTAGALKPLINPRKQTFQSQEELCLRNLFPGLRSYHALCLMLNPHPTPPPPTVTGLCVPSLSSHLTLPVSHLHEGPGPGFIAGLSGEGMIRRTAFPCRSPSLPLGCIPRTPSVSSKKPSEIGRAHV